MVQDLLDLIIERLRAEGILQHAYVDRGDPASLDFDKYDFTADAGWHELDLSSIVPEGVVAVHCYLNIKTAGVGNWLMFRKNGNSNAINRVLRRTQEANQHFSTDFIVCVDDDRKIEYAASNVSWYNIDFAVRGWFL